MRESRKLNDSTTPARRWKTERRRAYKELYAAVANILYQHDPVDLNFGDNSDEYELEASTILPRLKSATSDTDVQRIVAEEFARWFGEDFAGDPRIGAAADEIWRAWVASPVSGPSAGGC